MLDEGPFDIVRWIAPLMSPENRQRLKAEVKTLREMSPGRKYLFPEGIGKKRVSFGLSTAFDPAFQHFLDWETVEAQEIQAKLSRLGAPKVCRVVGPEFEHYEEVQLLRALESMLSYDDGQDVLILCRPGKLLCWQNQYFQLAIVAKPD